MTMTKIELTQGDGIFVRAGKRAFMLGIEVSGNPYKDKQKILWEKGWKTAKKQFYSNKKEK